jgi:hypothetical protein
MTSVAGSYQIVAHQVVRSGLLGAANCSVEGFMGGGWEHSAGPWIASMGEKGD